ncbi:MazG nucleotide pyrophosphohydrolase domain-containing protein [Vibrio marisflavi]|uniref:NTP pyrophosphohydrolase MazG-like domain-containing protein n=1 Tax=Vibrio marisflavi CECT 7928 TaxID=634439 RepID=A0ABM9A0F8_9VIBR|nr:MazG nucleotide pyrophosphohydrolase domain-containing protein [Vibrio marisflavi]CAH0536930.1 hypothetical protein VMF7928_00820 [Vibrio marisflavi CECT 7928]
MDELNQLIGVARRKADLDKVTSWSAGSQTYLQEIKNEVDEVVEEIEKKRLCFLEDELADVLWDYVNSLIALEQEKGVCIDSVLRRACRKYEERVSALESGIAWDNVKQKQKQRLIEEHAKAE